MRTPTAIRKMGAIHAKHHQTDQAQGWWLEFLDYFKPSIVILWAGFPFSIAAGCGFVTGGIIYAAMAAYAQQVQHENPELVFWLPRPVHHLHHKHHMWRHNFGILVDVWDRVFGTYRKAEWQPTKRPSEYPWRAFFQIKWY
jgi:sterol desaturase/sphingolipid hydroxylase (fatty acid hydroxylase superfamily)